MAGRDGGKRSRSGCITCKIRRVKCDESRPECTRCVQAGRTCDGYVSSTQPHQSRRALADAVRQLPIAGPASRLLGEPVLADDAACFDFFRHCTAGMTGSVLPGAQFWGRQLLQAAHSERAVWRVAVALGALHRRWEHSNSRTSAAAAVRQRDGNDAIASFTQQAASHYYGAISLAKAVQDPATLAVVSAALAAAAHLAGLWAESQVHIHAGLRLLQDMQTPTIEARAMPADEVEGIAQSLERLDLQAMLFEDSREPYDYQGMPDFVGVIRAPAWDGVELRDISEAALVVFRLVRHLLIVGTAAERGVITLRGLEAANSRLVEDAARWEMALAVLLAQTGAKDGVRERSMVLSMRLYHITLVVCLTAGVAGPETRWDACLPLFERIVALADEIARNTHSPLAFFMSLEPGIAAPLFVVAVRCRHPIVRRRALNLLSTLNRQEGIWNCGLTGRVAEQCVMWEEEGLGIQLPLRAHHDDLDLVSAPETANVPVVVDADGYSPVWPWGWPNVPEPKRVLQTSLIARVDTGILDLTMYAAGNDGLGIVTKTASLEM
ncbi:hypothetical protein B0H67DRAFT_349307 [Lasiosphaeris hirsuta]|uniref:Zn(2)-C6 fungal-type domain-containing protein n=1 Tax=Lasiosphaeris hirsuta TaxID=260670 RepID=A0AA39ZVD4_9PEZI|nr:hypothetical protein B0H67DRAFT_349307 [Lasiosphaeris hirsuta]